MTGLTGIGRRQVRQRFARCDRAVVAAHAISGYAGVAEGRRRPRCRAVARAAIGRGNYVIARLAGGDRTVVTAGAGAGDLGVINSHRRRPRQRAVTRVAAIGAGDMAWRLAGSRGAVVAA